MGMVFGKIGVETQKYEVIKSITDYEIRKYAPSVVAEVTYNPSQFKGNKDGGFMVLVNYIGAFGNPQNTKPEKIAMTAPVITKDTGGSSEKIAMTAPVVTKDGGEEGVNKMVTMQFILPATYCKAEEAPTPTDERIVIREEGERKYGVVKFGGVATDEVVREKVERLRMSLERDGFKVIGDFLLARYNPPWRTIPVFRTNEVSKVCNFAESFSTATTTGAKIPMTEKREDETTSKHVTMTHKWNRSPSRKCPHFADGNGNVVGGRERRVKSPSKKR